MTRLRTALLLTSLASFHFGCAPKPSVGGTDAGIAATVEIAESDVVTDTHVLWVDADNPSRQTPLYFIPQPGGRGGLQSLYSYMFPSKMAWSPAVIRWSYNPSGQPAGFSSTDVVNSLIASARQWEAVCGIRFEYIGQSNAALTSGNCDGRNSVGWGALEGSTIGYNQDCYSGSRLVESDMVLDNTQINSLNLLQTVATHEFGHGIGLGHTNVNPAIMTAFLSTGNLQADDIDGCLSIYGPSAVPQQTPTPTPTPVPPTPSPTPQATPVPPPPTATPAPTPAPTPQATPTPIPLLCQPGEKRSCSLRRGNGVQTCSASGRSWGLCRRVR